MPWDILEWAFEKLERVVPGCQLPDCLVCKRDLPKFKALEKIVKGYRDALRGLSQGN